MKLLFSKLFVLTSVLMVSVVTYAKQYSDISLHILGYDNKQKSVLVEENSASYEVPKIYAYPLNEVQYDLAKYDQRFDHLSDSILFKQKLSSIQPKLKPLKAINIDDFKINLQEQSSSDTDTMNAQHFNRIYTSIFTISNAKFQSTKQNLISYTPDIKLKQAFELPKNKGVLITFESLALPFDQGYTREESVVLLPHQ